MYDVVDCYVGIVGVGLVGVVVGWFYCLCVVGVFCCVD